MNKQYPGLLVISYAEHADFWLKPENFPKIWEYGEDDRNNSDLKLSIDPSVLDRLPADLVLTIDTDYKDDTQTITISITSNYNLAELFLNLQLK